MSVTLELTAPPGETLTADLLALGAEIPAVSSLVLTESLVPGIYRGTFDAGPEGTHRVLVYDQDEMPVLITGVHLTGQEQTAYCSEAALEAAQIDAIYARLLAQVPEGPVFVVPAPSTPTKTVAWGYCYDADGSPAAGVAVALWLERADPGGHGLYSTQKMTALSDSEGVVTFEIPRNPQLRFVVKRGKGAPMRFSCVDAAALELPRVIGP